MSQGAIVSLNKNTLENEGGCWGSRDAAWRRETHLKESIVSVRKLLHQIEMCAQNGREGECVHGERRGSGGGLSVFNILDLWWKISKADAGISFECTRVLAGLAGEQAGTCCRPSAEPPSSPLRSVSLPWRQSVIFLCFIVFLCCCLSVSSLTPQVKCASRSSIGTQWLIHVQSAESTGCLCKSNRTVL